MMLPGDSLVFVLGGHGGPSAWVEVWVASGGSGCPVELLWVLDFGPGRPPCLQ